MLFLLSSLGPLERTLARQKEVFTRDWLYVGAALAHESISVQVAIRLSRCGAKGCGMYSSTHELDFLLSHVSSATAKQYSVLVIHGVFSFHQLGSLSGPE